MAEIDRLARLESCIRGVNAWNTSYAWIEKNRDRIYSHEDGSGRAQDLPDDRMSQKDKMILLSENLCGRHRGLISHIRDHDPLHHDDLLSDIMIGVMRHTSSELLRRLPDDPQGFRDLWTLSLDYEDSDLSILSEENRSESLLDDVDDLHRLHEFTIRASQVIDRFISETASIVFDRTNGVIRLNWSGFSVTGTNIDVDVNDYYDTVTHRSHVGEYQINQRFRTEMSASLPSYDWRRYDPQYEDVFGQINTPFEHRMNDGHQFDETRHRKTPEAFAGAILRWVNRL